MKDNVWFVKPGTKELVTPYERYEAATPIVTAQPFTVSMVAAVVAEDLDGWFRGGNDSSGLEGIDRCDRGKDGAGERNREDGSPETLLAEMARRGGCSRLGDSM